jgi:putative oxidoreductase
MSTGFLIARLVLGLGLAAHGAQKLFGWFGGYGLTGTGGFLAGLGFRPGVLFALMAGLGEVAGGLLTAAGLFGPVGPALVMVVMLVAILAVHRPNGFFASSNGVELPLLYIMGVLPIAVAGPGRYSLDGLLGLPIHYAPTVSWAAIAVAVLLALLNVAARRPGPAPAPSHS